MDPNIIAQNEKAAEAYYGSQKQHVAFGPRKYTAKVKIDKPNHKLDVEIVGIDGKLKMPRPADLLGKSDAGETSSFHTDESMKNYMEEDPAEFRYVNANIGQPFKLPITEETEHSGSSVSG